MDQIAYVTIKALKSPTEEKKGEGVVCVKADP